MKKISLIFLICAAALSACTNEKKLGALVIPSESHKGVASDAQIISTSEAWERVKNGATLVDVRDPEDYASGHLAQAINIPYTELSKKEEEISIEKEKEIVLYCNSGHRAGLAQQKLMSLGYIRVFNGGGYSDLVKTQEGLKPINK